MLSRIAIGGDDFKAKSEKNLHCLANVHLREFIVIGESSSEKGLTVN